MHRVPASYSGPTVLWGLLDAHGQHIEAVGVPMGTSFGLVLKVNGRPRRATDYPSVEALLGYAERLRLRLTQRPVWSGAMGISQD